MDTFPRPNPSMASVYRQTQRHALDRDMEPWGLHAPVPPPQAHVLAVLCNLIRAPTKASCSLLLFFSPPLPLSFKVHRNSSFTKTDFPSRFSSPLGRSLSAHTFESLPFVCHTGLSVVALCIPSMFAQSSSPPAGLLAEC